MIDFNTIVQKARTSQRDLLPTAVKNRIVENDFIFNTQLTSGSFSITNGTGVTITTTISGLANENIRMGACPFEVALFETSATAANLIPFGTGIAAGRYTVTNLAMPDLTLIGSNGNNLVFKTHIINNSGSTQTILYYIQSRFIQGIGGGA